MPRHFRLAVAALVLTAGATALRAALPTFWQVSTEADFLRHTEGGPIRRIGYERWRRNLAVGLGNALHADPQREDIRGALVSARATATALVQEHIDWALR